MVSLSVRPNMNASLKLAASPSHELPFMPFTTSSFFAPNVSSSQFSSALSELKVSQREHKVRVLMSEAAAKAVLQDKPISDSRLGKKKRGVVEKPRLVLKFIWTEKNLGLALDQMIAGHGTIPLSLYYFWPQKDAWEELKVLMESKPWISKKQMIVLLNQATDMINLWQQRGGESAPS